MSEARKAGGEKGLRGGRVLVGVGVLRAVGRGAKRRGSESGRRERRSGVARGKGTNRSVGMSEAK